MMDDRGMVVRFEIDSGRFPIDLRVQLPVCIGADEAAGIRWSDHLLQPLHCEVYQVGEEVYVRTLSASAPLTVNYQVVATPVVLQHHDLIGIGAATIRVLLTAPSEWRSVTCEQRSVSNGESRTDADTFARCDSRQFPVRAISASQQKASLTPRSGAKSLSRDVRAVVTSSGKSAGDASSDSAATVGRQAVLPQLNAGVDHPQVDPPSKPVTLVLEEERMSVNGPVNTSALQSLQVDARPLRKS